MNKIFCDLCGEEIDPKKKEYFKLTIEGHNETFAEDTKPWIMTNIDICDRCIEKYSDIIYKNPEA